MSIYAAICCHSQVPQVEEGGRIRLCDLVHVAISWFLILSIEFDVNVYMHTQYMVMLMMIMMFTITMIMMMMMRTTTMLMIISQGLKQ